MGAGTSFERAGVESALSASSDASEANASSDLKNILRANLSLRPEKILKARGSLKSAADQDGVPVSMRSSSDGEAVTTLDGIFLGVPRVVLEYMYVYGCLVARIMGHYHRPSL